MNLNCDRCSDITLLKLLQLHIYMCKVITHNPSDTSHTFHLQICFAKMLSGDFKTNLKSLGHLYILMVSMH